MLSDASLARGAHHWTGDQPQSGRQELNQWRPHGNFNPAPYPNTKIYLWNFNPTTQVWFISTNALLTKF